VGELTLGITATAAGLLLVASSQLVHADSDPHARVSGRLLAV